MRLFAFFLGVFFSIVFILFFINKETTKIGFTQDAPKKQKIQNTLLNRVAMDSFDMEVVSFKELSALLNTQKNRLQ